MSKDQKLVNRLLSTPRDFTWDELIKLLSVYGYTEAKKGKSGGSRRKFIDDKKNVINLHKPHPSNILKTYAIKDVIAHLKEKGHIKDE
ncbi:MAG: type II toxin-antitoxin system HicA family toxin [Chitinophagaceae bacterium]|nr:type II toxin-antitoxin system HicA family toxin [Chitinophagaceae bacterium]